jgi:hypothetical protein
MRTKPSAFVTETLQIIADCKLGRDKPGSVRAWAQSLIELGRAEPTVCKLANEAGSYSLSEFNSNVKNALKELDLVSPKRESQAEILAMYAAISISFDDDKALTAALANADYSNDDLYDIAVLSWALDDINDGTSPAYHDPDIVVGQHWFQIRAKCEVWLSKHVEMIEPFRNKVEKMTK